MLKARSWASVHVIIKSYWSYGCSLAAGMATKVQSTMGYVVTCLLCTGMHVLMFTHTHTCKRTHTHALMHICTHTHTEPEVSNSNLAQDSLPRVSAVLYIWECHHRNSREEITWVGWAELAAVYNICGGSSAAWPAAYYLHAKFCRFLIAIKNLSLLGWLWWITILSPRMTQSGGYQYLFT